MPEPASTLSPPELLSPPLKARAHRQPSLRSAPYDIADVRTIRARGRTITLAGIEGFDQNQPAVRGTEHAGPARSWPGMPFAAGSATRACVAAPERRPAPRVRGHVHDQQRRDLAHALVADGLGARARRCPPALWGRGESGGGTRSRAVGLAHGREGKRSVMPGPGRCLGYASRARLVSRLPIVAPITCKTRLHPPELEA